MLPDTLPQLVDTLLRLPHLDSAQLRELIQHLPDPRAAAQEMVLRGWITQDQFSSLFPDPEQRPTGRETLLVGFGDDESLPDADCEDWSLPLCDEEDQVGATSTAQSPSCWDAPLPQAERGERGLSPPTPLPQRERGEHRLPRPEMGWASKGLLVGSLFFGTFFAGMQYFGANSKVRPVAQEESREARAVALPPAPPVVPINILPPVAAINAQFDQVIQALQTQDANRVNAQFERVRQALQAHETICSASRQSLMRYPVAPQARANVSPQPTGSIYERVRQVVRENKTEETKRLGMGDLAYRDVPDDGSIMVGMTVTYAPFFDHQIIKSVQPIYQRPDGSRYSGQVCGNPTGTSECVLARDGYAIGGATIKAGMGIDGMQLTFMEIGAGRLNPGKTYLSQWLGGYGGADATTFINDGRPIIGIAGMRSSRPSSPAFCLGLVTTQAEAIADPPGECYQTSRATSNVQQREAAPFHVGQPVWVEWSGQMWDASILQAQDGRYLIAYSGFGSEWDEWVGPGRIAVAR